MIRKKEKAKKICLQCNQEFEVFPCRKNKAKYCSIVCYRASWIGDNNPAKKPDIRKKISEKVKGRHVSTEFKKGHKAIHPFPKGSKHPSFKNWASREPYGKDFSPELKKGIRERDNFTCQECGFHKDQLKSPINIHHIDYNKRNNNPNNLITLCRSCHTKTNWRREDWIKYFQEKLLGKSA